jgi:hypothetical protein
VTPMPLAGPPSFGVSPTRSRSWTQADPPRAVRHAQHRGPVPVRAVVMRDVHPPWIGHSAHCRRRARRRRLPAC